MASGTSLALASGAATHVGRIRTHNEDCYLDHAAAGLWAIADGMGGHDAGDLASCTLVEALRGIEPCLSAAHLLSACEARVIAANRQLQQWSQERRQTIGTTLAALLVFECHFACVWCGDSRLYRIRADGILQLTRDHTEVQALIDAGALTEAERRSWPRRNVITRAIGVEASPELEIAQGTLVEGDLFVLCSDGLTAHVEDAEILALARGQDVQGACAALIALALDRGGTDNVTVLIVRIGGTLR